MILLLHGLRHSVGTVAQKQSNALWSRHLQISKSRRSTMFKIKEKNAADLFLLVCCFVVGAFFFT